MGDKLESGSEYRFVRSEDILNSHLKICSSISVPRRSSHHDDDDEDDNDEDDLLMDASSNQKGSGLVICLTRIRRHVFLSLSLSSCSWTLLVLPCFFCLRPLMDLVVVARCFFCFGVDLLMASVHAVDL